MHQGRHCDCYEIFCHLGLFYEGCNTCNNNTTVCPPVRGDNPRAEASGLSPVQVDKPWYTCNYFILPSSVYTLISMKYVVLKCTSPGKGGI